MIPERKMTKSKGMEYSLIILEISYESNHDGGDVHACSRPIFRL
jgi:hypothetical protein